MIQVQFYSLNCKICIIRSPLLWSHIRHWVKSSLTCDHNTMVYIRPRAHRLGAWFANSRPTLVLGIWWWGVNGLLSVKRELRWNSCVVWDSSMSYSTYATTDVHCDKSLFAACSWHCRFDAGACQFPAVRYNDCISWPIVICTRDLNEAKRQKAKAASKAPEYNAMNARNNNVNCKIRHSKVQQIYIYAISGQIWNI